MTFRQAGRILNAGLSRCLFRCAKSCFFSKTEPGLEAMNKPPRKPAHNVLRLPTKPCGISHPARDFPGDAAAPGALASAGSPGDPRMQEAMRLIEAFLAIEDESARAALIALAESLVTHDWVRGAQRR
jgi:hypothetical protein